MQTAATQHRVDVSAPPVLRAASFNAHGGDDDDDDVDIDEVNVHGSGAAMPIDRIVDRGAGHDRRAPSSRDVKRQQRQVASGPENYTESGYGGECSSSSSFYSGAQELRSLFILSGVP